jgi:hypothetical protein
VNIFVQTLRYPLPAKKTATNNHLREHTFEIKKHEIRDLLLSIIQRKPVIK